SRRRHTRCYRDWSSDVCSSDLSATDQVTRWSPPPATEARIWTEVPGWITARSGVTTTVPGVTTVTNTPLPLCADALSAITKYLRSEERRVGKEGITRWTAHHDK